MTRFFVDEKEIPAPVDISSLNLVLKHIEGSHLAPNSCVRQIRMDGLPLLPEDFSGDTRLPVPCHEKIEIFTGSFAEIAQDSVSEAIAYLDRIEILIPSLAAGLQTAPVPEAFESLRELYEGLRWLSLLMDKLESRLQIGLADVSPGKMSATEYQQKLIRVLRQLLRSQKEGNFVLLSDSLGNELLPLVACWREAFDLMRKRVVAAQQQIVKAPSDC